MKRESKYWVLIWAGMFKFNSVVNNIALMQWKAVVKAIEQINKFCSLGCLNLIGSCHFSNLQHVCGDSFNALRCRGVSRVEMKIYEWSLQALLSLPCFRISSCMPLICPLFTISPKWRASSQASPTVVSLMVLHWTVEPALWLPCLYDHLFITATIFWPKCKKHWSFY